MMRIMLACAAIWAVPEAEVEKNVGEFDILLVGPQIRFKAKEFEKLAAGRFPVHIIDMRDYGTMNGAKVFNTAMEVYNNFNK